MLHWRKLLWTFQQNFNQSNCLLNQLVQNKNEDIDTIFGHLIQLSMHPAMFYMALIHQPQCYILFVFDLHCFLYAILHFTTMKKEKNTNKWERKGKSACA